MNLQIRFATKPIPKPIWMRKIAMKTPGHRDRESLRETLKDSIPIGKK
jgi:hypothetical protein